MSRKNACVVCYEDVATGELGWAELKITELDDWKIANPTFAPRYMFAKHGDILARDNLLTNTFNKFYADYGLRADSLDKEYIAPNGHTIVVKGIAACNRKYPIIIEDLTDNRRYKVSKAYISKVINAASA